MLTVIDSDQQDNTFFPLTRSNTTMRQSWQSSGTFEFIQCTTPQHSLITYIITARQRIILNQPLKNIHQLDQQEWKSLLKNPHSIQSVINHMNMTYSLCHGLSQQNKLLYWQHLSKEKLTKRELKANDSLKQKYDKSIKHYTEKLKYKINSQYEQNQLSQIIKFVEDVLTNYYNYDPQIGFCKSMEYLAFGIISSLKQHQSISAKLLENAHYYFSIILKKRKLRDMFLPGNPGLFAKISEFKIQVKDEIPKLFEKIESIGKGWHHLFYKHFLTVFMHKLPYRQLYSVLIELLILEGYNLIIYILKRILFESQKELLQMNSQQLEAHLIDNIFYHFVSKFKRQEIPKCMYNILVKNQQLTK